MNALLRRSFTTSCIRPGFRREWTRSPADHTPRKDLEWLFQRPEPVPLPKSIQRPLADGSTFHQLVRPRPLYMYVDPSKHPQEVIEKTLPPVVHNRHGSFPMRTLTADEEQQMVVRWESDAKRWTVQVLSEEFKCSKLQVKKVLKKAMAVTGQQASGLFDARQVGRQKPRRLVPSRPFAPARSEY